MDPESTKYLVAMGLEGQQLFIRSPFVVDNVMYLAIKTSNECVHQQK